MTRRDQFIRSRAWLRMHTFVVTKSLRKRLELLSEDERIGYCYVQNKVLITTEEYRTKRAFIPTRYWKQKLGARYRDVLSRLQEWHELDVHEEFRWSRDKSGYPMSYSIPPSALRTGTCIMELGKKRVRLPRPKNKPTDAASHHALECLQQLTVPKDLEFPPPEDSSKSRDVRRVRIKGHMEHIAGGDFALGYGKNVKRLYHRILMMPSEGRCNLRYWYPLVEFDVKTCHPVLMLSLFKDESEHRLYCKMLAGDIYAQIGEDMGITDRDQVKQDFQSVVNIRHKKLDWMKKQYVFQFYIYHFPKFASQVLFNRTDLAHRLQNLEARLMVQQLGLFCRAHSLFWIPMHDGFISVLEHGPTISNEAQKIIKDAVGFSPTITCTPIEP